MNSGTILLENDVIQELREITAKITDLSKDNRTELHNQLVALFENRSFTPEQIEAIKNAASPTLFGALPDDEPLFSEDGFPSKTCAEKLSEILTDTPGKSAGTFRMLIQTKKHEMLREDIPLSSRRLMDIVHNIPLLLGENVPENIEERLLAYEDIADRLLSIHTKLNPEQPSYDFSEINYLEGYDTLAALPEETFSLNNKNSIIHDSTMQELSKLLNKVNEQITEYRSSGGLTETFMNKTFPAKLTQAIDNAATSTAFIKTARPEANNKPSKDYALQLSHTLIDPIAKLCMNIWGTIDGMEENEPYCDEHDLLEVIDPGLTCLTDILHNYPRLAGNTIPDSTQNLLDTYGKIFDKLTEAKASLEEQGITSPKDSSDHRKGMDHLKPIPEEILALC